MALCVCNRRRSKHIHTQHKLTNHLEDFATNTHGLFTLPGRYCCKHAYHWVYLSRDFISHFSSEPHSSCHTETYFFAFYRSRPIKFIIDCIKTNHSNWLHNFKKSKSKHVCKHNVNATKQRISAGIPVQNANKRMKKSENTAPNTRCSITRSAASRFSYW